VDEIFAAYLAGLIDGEGSIQINPNGGKKARYHHWTLTVQISSSANGYLQQLRQDAGLGGSLTSWQSKVWVKRRSYNWRFYGASADGLLRLCLPYLRLKRPQAEVALQFRDECCHFHGGRWNMMPTELLLARRSFAMRMRELNASDKKSGAGKGAGVHASSNYLNVR